MAFLKYTGKRMLALIPVLLGISLIAFLLGVLSPSDPVDHLFNDDETTTQEQRDQLRHDLGLDQPVLLQYGSWLSRALRGNLGQS